MQTYDLNGKRVIVTGSTGGIGRELCTQFTDAGCHVIGVARNEMKLKVLLVDMCIDDFFVLDFEDTKYLEDEVAALLRKIGQVDILVNNAGFFELRSIEDLKIVDMHKMFAINVFGPIVMAKHCVENMKKRKEGRIFNIGSSSCYNGGMLTSLYCASKHSLLGFSKAASDELRQHNIRVCNLSPSSTKSAMGQIPLATEQKYETFIDPAEVARTCVFLARFDGNMEVREILLNRVRTQ